MQLSKKLIRKALAPFGFDAVRCGPDILMMRRAAGHLEHAQGLTHTLLWQHLEFLLQQFQVNCVLDVGANTGEYARSLRHRGYQGHIISFEPIRELYEKLCALASRDSKWKVYPFALGSKNFRTRIHVTNGTDFSSLLRPNAYSQTRFGAAAQVARTEEIEVQRLDALLDEILAPIQNPRVFLKLDTQGYDLEAFAGLGRQAEKLVGLQSEVSVIPLYQEMPPMSEALARYEAQGFEIAGLYPITRDKATSRVIEFDCVLVRAAALS